MARLAQLISGIFDGGAVAFTLEIPSPSAKRACGILFFCSAKLAIIAACQRVRYGSIFQL